ncbi:cystinosin-like [Corticium candelabrum]|uniref:cystinosin-like n=1 Tax=Corticium candelabrum TaxID=121492 RepID=UPI002E275F29|nr:cystinosin-like [Corticium candelabrum]
MTLRFRTLFLMAALAHTACSVDGLYITFSHPDNVVIGRNTSFTVTVRGLDVPDADLEIKPKENGRIHVVSMVELRNDTDITPIKVEGLQAGTAYITFNSSNEAVRAAVLDIEVSVTVIHSEPLDVAIVVVGWIYFFAWSISFYPQIVYNFQRKSVVGLNFDFLAYNITGFLLYGLFNVGMYWIPEVKEEYKRNHPNGVNPVLLNDVVFTLHAIAAISFTIFQCLIFERGKQRVSTVARVLVSLVALFVIVTIIPTSIGTITWLDYLYYFSYIKLGSTLIKYIPQAFMNYRRKSTEGWSIGNILLDFTGGVFSVLQMFMLAYNHDDWNSIFGDVTKFGLGFFSICFDILFIVQHYCLYRKFRGYKPVDSTEVAKSPQKRKYTFV